jgi:outer membrane translocation and assembly module TamA
MKCFLSNSIGRARASQRLLHLLRSITTAALLAALAGSAAGQDFVLRTDHLTDPALADALQASFNLDERARASLLDPDTPATISAIEAEQAKLGSVMAGFGYLDAEVEWVLDAAIAAYQFRPKPGPHYVIGAVAVSLPRITDPEWAGDLEAIAQTVIGSPARGDIIGQLVDDLAHRLEASGFPSASVTARDVTPDEQTGLALVQVTLDPGEAATFGAVTLADARVFTMERLLELIPFSLGERYDPDQVEALRSALAAEPGLRSARVSVAESAEGEGRLTVAVRVREAVAADLLGNRQAAGQGVLLAVLMLLTLRQVTVAAGGAVHSPLVQSQTILCMIAMAVAAWFVARRFIEFAGIG